MPACDSLANRDGVVCLRQRGREGSGRQAVGQEAGDAMVARIVHMQLVVRDDVLHPILAARHPMPHHGEAPEHRDFQVVDSPHRWCPQWPYVWGVQVCAGRIAGPSG